ncbi:FAD-dependent oxidoreductase [Novosphingobium pentaromativorans]|uniref:FAD-dependent oxidoreductase n=2 Tax=Novosphingobium pentaromativorans TaxID=205844 RepID=UPI00051F5F98|nr:FAD-dependent oxidoreductase [Novosphingobium pentaromativorans]AIT79824.1 hypothetical protein JI59_08580 [Novosphingobium pentaromativorans US6-1]
MAGFDESFDIVVVGSGGGGFCAALTALDAGRSVLVLESTDMVGGSTAMSGGALWVPNNPLQAKAGVKDSRDASLTYIQALNTHDNSALRQRRDAAFVDEASEMVSFLMRRGVPLERCEGWSDYHDELPGGSVRGRSLSAKFFDLRKLGDWASRLRRGAAPFPLKWPEFAMLPLVKRTARAKFYAARLGLRLTKMKITGAQLVGMGTALQGRMLKEILDAGGEIRTDSPVNDLVRNDSGRVTGVIAEIDGKTRRIEARLGVIVAAGGFAHNQQMRDEHGPKPAHADWTHANPGDTGSMLSVMMKHGAATDMMDNAIWLVTSKLPSGYKIFHIDDIAKPHAIMVTPQGRRFTDESGSNYDNGRNMYAAGATPGWAILDSRHRDRYIWAGAMPGKTPPEWFESGYMKKAETIEELARLCGMDQAVLAETISRFNRAAETGVDDDFGRGARAYDRAWGDPTVRPNPVLGAISEAPFYAVQVFPGDVGTTGGVVINEHGNVLDREENPIEGLYAAGNSTASIFGRTYPGAGATIAATFTFGYVGVQHALRGAKEAKAAA